MKKTKLLVTESKLHPTRVLLLVDADGDCEELVRRTTAQAGYELISVRTSAAAFAVLAGRMRGLDLMIVDVDPGAHSLALLEAMTSCAERPPIVVLTSLEEAYMKPIALEHGAVACLSKPVPSRKLVTTVAGIPKRALSCDLWGSPLPPHMTVHKHPRDRFQGIAAKLAPDGLKRRVSD